VEGWANGVGGGVGELAPSLASAARRRHRATELERWVVAAAGHVGSVVDEAEAVAPRTEGVKPRCL
jgi:hypothetical protein